MGNCVGDTTRYKCKADKGSESNLERQLIELLYQDLARRSADGLLSRDTFEHFFHLNGLWAEAVFNAFDTKKKGTITADNFCCMLKLLAKGSSEVKLQALFKFYDVHDDNKLSYQQLLKMVGFVLIQFYSYPKDELLELFNDKSFYDSLTVRHQLQLIRNSTKEEGEEQSIEEMEIIEEEQEGTPTTPREKKQSLIVENPQEFIVISPSGSVKSADFSSVAVNEFEQEQPRFTYKINVMIRKYAEFLFKEFGLDHRTMSLSLENFKELIKKHPKLYNSYEEGFHTELWKCDSKNHCFLEDEKPWVEGYLMSKPMEGQDKKYYVRFIKESLIIYKNPESKVPIQIIFLPGLIVSGFKSCMDELGFHIKHRDGHYPQRIFTVKDRKQFGEWSHHFQAYFNTSVQDKYLIKEEIGAGSHSIVQRCIKKSNLREFAIKVIDKQKLTETERELIRSEVDIMSKCNHINIIRLKETFETKTNLYIITELIKDGDLFDFVTENRKCTEQEASQVAEDVLLTVKYLNEQGLVHRDLKAENLMVILDPDTKQISKAKIIDFGFAIYIDTLKDKSPGGRYVGTPGYTAPEILNLKSSYDVKVDMFSIGVIVYFMLVGDLPFNSHDKMQTIENARHGRYSMSGPAWKAISDEAKNFIKKCLLTNPNDRMSVEEALEHTWIVNHGLPYFPQQKVKRGDSKKVPRLSM